MSGEDPGGRLPVRGTVSGEELERVIGRAAELQLARQDVPATLDDDEVVEIAREVGLEPRHVRQALAEMRAEAMLPERRPDRSLAGRLWGPATVSASRVVPGDPAEILRQLGPYLSGRESLRCVRDRSGLQVWEPAEDLMSKLQRSLDFGGRGYELAKARSLEVMVQPLEEGRSLVTMTVDLSNQRSGQAAGWYASLGAVGLGLAIGIVTGEGASAALVAPVAGGAAFAVGTLGTAKTLGRRRRRVRLAVQGLLDRIERGSPLAAERLTLRERISGLLQE